MGDKMEDISNVNMMKKRKPSTIRILLIFLVSISLCAVTSLYLRQRLEDKQTKDKKEDIINLFSTSDFNKLSEEEITEIEPSEKIDAGTLGIMTIEKLDIQAPIGIGFEEETLRYQIGSYSNIDDFGKKGTNVGFTAHSATFVCSYCYFDRINELTIGDQLRIIWKDGNEYVFEVVESHLWQQPESDYVSQTDPDESRITLVTCSQGHREYRDFVIFKLINKATKSDI